MPKKQNKQEQILLKLEVIVVDDSVQSRVTLNNDIIDDYRNKYENGVVMPPLRAVHDKKEHILADGFHRFYALKRAGIGEAEFVVTDGTVEDAKFISITSNTEHGLPRTNADKRKAVIMALQNECFKNFSDRSLAETLKVGHTLVSKIRQEISCPPSTTGNSEDSQDSENDPIIETIEKSFEKEKRTGKDGKKYPVTKKKLKPVRKKTIHKEPPPIKELKYEIRNDNDKCPSKCCTCIDDPLPFIEGDDFMYVSRNIQRFFGMDDKYLHIHLPLPLDSKTVLTIIRNAVGKEVFEDMIDWND